MKPEFKSIKGISIAAALILACLAWSTTAFGGEIPLEAQKTYYQQEIQRQIEICQSKSALQFSRFENVRKLGRKYGLKLAYLTRLQDQLVTGMVDQSIAAKSYRVSRFITADFHRTIEKYEMKLALR